MTTQSLRQPAKRLSRTKLRVYNDLVLFVGMVLVLAPQATGIPLHEWGSVLILLPFLLHLLLDWQWIVSVSQRIFKHQNGQTRFNYYWNWFMFVMGVLATFSGFWVSEALLPSIGFPITIDPFWVEIHAFTANSVMIMLGVHLAMHWKWITTNWRNYILRRGKSTKRSAA